MKNTLSNKPTVYILVDILLNVQINTNIMESQQYKINKVFNQTNNEIQSMQYNDR